ncbi:MAG: VanW family protein [Candidatus Shapirobacteria bacterium]|nr:VanW family protein [Candidatus Shapirobacteria bacterium]MDD5073661.1 VanW family protein [Candidatus Shapirobacteria bacterium]MDD5481378.1 VanW family protein [Candidatus Shapirobacteria bacterium]
MTKKIKKTKTGKNFGWFIFTGLIALGLMIPAVYELAFYGQIYPGVKIQGIVLGNLTPQEAQKKLEQQIRSQTPETITFQFEDQQWRLAIIDLNLKFSADQAIAAAYRIGRNGTAINRLKEKITAWQKGINLNLDWYFNQETVDKQINLIAKNLDRPGRPTQLLYQGTNIVVHPGQEGLSVDQRRLKELAISQIVNLGQEPILIPTRTINPVPNQETITRLQEQSQSLRGKKIILELEAESFVINDTDLVSFLHYNPAASQNNIAKWVADFANQVNRSPKNARFSFQNETLLVTEPSWSGQKVEEKELINLIEKNLISLAAGNDKEIIFDLPAQIVPAKTRAEDANSLGIKERIGQGESHYRGSSTSRVNNIKVAAQELNGQLVAPEEIFSFNNALGEVTFQAGYQTGYIIKNGQTIPGIGGGVCQVSTTLFRAILDAGLPVEERHPHAYRVGVYEQESQPGLDATVFAPSPDLKFKNDTGHYLLVQTVFLPQEWRLIIDFYGTNDGRLSSLSNFRLWDVTPPPPPLYIDDPSLPKDEIKQIDWAAYGAKAAFDWEVVRDGKILQKETFYSYYQPWQAKYLKGTGGNN